MGDPVKTLTNEDCSEWLASRKVLANPYNSPQSRAPYCEQFSLPHHAPSISALFRSIVACVQPFAEALLQVTDWAHYSPDEMAVIVQIRLESGEHRPLIEAPGHAFDATEHDLLIGLLSLVTSCGMTAYLYFDHGVTFLSWEGDLLDFYCSDIEHYKAVCELMQHMDISSNATGHA
jgi:hypothetical protein